MQVTTEEKELIDQEVLALQQKHAIHRVPESNSHDRSQFISPYLLFPKKGEAQTSSQSQRFKAFCGVSAFQNSV